MEVHAVPAHRADEVAQLGGGRHDGDSAGAARGGAAGRRQREQRQDRRTRAGQPEDVRTTQRPAAEGRAKTRPEITAIVDPGGALVSTESQMPPTPSSAVRATEPICHGRSLRVHRRTVAAGTTISADAGGRPPRRGPRSSRRRPGREGRDRAPRSAGRWPEHRRDRTRSPATAGRARRSPQGQRRGDAGEDQVAGVDHEEAPEEEGLDAGGRPEDVTREDHPDRQAAGEDDRGEAVVAGPTAARERPHADREDHRRAECPQHRREAQPVGQHESREGRRADRVGEEGETPKDDPCAQEARCHDSSRTSATPRWTNGS